MSSTVLSSKNPDVLVVLDFPSTSIDNKLFKQLIQEIAGEIPVLVVQPNLPSPKYSSTESELKNVALLSIYSNYGTVQRQLLNSALLAKGYINPIFLICNWHFSYYLSGRYSLLNIFYDIHNELIANLNKNELFFEHSFQKFLDQCQVILSSVFLNHDPKEFLGHLVKKIYPLTSDNVEGQLSLAQIIHSELEKKQQSAGNQKLKVAILYDHSSIHIKTVYEYLAAFDLYSHHQIFYIPVTRGLQCQTDLNSFDVLVVHYSVRLSIRAEGYISSTYLNAIKGFGGLKVLFLQDEYEGTENTREYINSLGFHTVYTCVPQEYVNSIYPVTRFPSTEFITTLTGFVPTELLAIKKIRKLSERSTLIAYRGRDLPFWYGTLGQEKLEIGLKVKEYCQKHDLPVDIECDDSKRIYGNSWYDFLSSSRATLGTESGANIFDFYGDIRKEIEARQKTQPNLAFKDIYAELIQSNENIKMNQISPKIFEAIALKTALVLYEGEYSGVVKPDLHYIPLKKDMSNIDEVIVKLQDDAYVTQITERAYADIIESDEYSYKNFITSFDNHLDSKLKNHTNANALWLCQMFQYDESGQLIPSQNQGTQLVSHTPLTPEQIYKTNLNFFRRYTAFLSSDAVPNKEEINTVINYLKRSMPKPVKQFIKRVIYR